MLFLRILRKNLMVFKPLMKLNKRQFWVSIWANYLVLFAGKNVITGNSFFLVSLRKTEIGEKQCWYMYNPNLECAFVQVDRQWSQHRSEYIFCFVGMNQPYLFCLRVLCNLMNEFIYWLDFIFLFLGLFEGPGRWMLGVSSCNTCQKNCVLCQTHYVLKTVRWRQKFPLS